ncbi:MAG: twin-arginine translocation signal domain-containing protein, partial [Gemmatimonadota bacterium]|nr:twin-arginine translocation signal domain-containing protein [Gemmatimonadota bacterium]
MSESNGAPKAIALFAKAGSRRDFLRNTALTAMVGGVVAACSADDSPAQATKVRDADHSGGTMAPNPAPLSPAAAAEAMD